ncbi:hypothetical protein [Alkalimarinus alittae]|uniref:Kinase n=1 Tax=Alkalimarinus alittae TaxID=2961619 RepID=A0ABY6N4I9_9ALTE|nr:hypothetical protein [Alkalimarinus alittae]UZE97004.1 hypothetical protein NKI27_04425 [Alkalimarinus alittae]
MSENNVTANNDNVSKNILIISVLGAVFLTIAALELTGKIKHNEAKDEFPVSSYQAILIKKGEEHKISRKPSNQTAQCINEYLFITADDDSNMQGLIVDYKNRGVRCQVAH